MNEREPSVRGLASARGAVKDLIRYLNMLTLTSNYRYLDPEVRQEIQRLVPYLLRFRDLLARPASKEHAADKPKSE